MSRPGQEYGSVVWLLSVLGEGGNNHDEALMEIRKAIVAAVFGAVIATAGHAQAGTTPRADSVESDWTFTDLAGEASSAWRAFASRAQRLVAQFRAVEKINQLGGTVEFAPWGPAWLSPLTSRVPFLGDVVGARLPGHRADKAVLSLGQCPSLKRVTLTYSVVGGAAGSFSITFYRYFEIDGKIVNPPSEKDRCRRFIDKLPGVTVQITANGEPVSFEEAFVGAYTVNVR
jgi:hypothetical protein